jgi:hypothetical protein
MFKQGFKRKTGLIKDERQRPKDKDQKTKDERLARILCLRQKDAPDGSLKTLDRILPIRVWKSP